MLKIAALVLTDTHLKEDNIAVNKKIFNQTIEYAKKLEIKEVYHLGDIFESRKAQPQHILNAFHEILNEFEKNDIKLISIVGNHDKTDYKSIKSFLTPFKFHKSFILIEEYYNQFLTDDIRVHYLPFFDNEIYREYLLDINQHYERLDEVKDILFTHIGVAGAVMNNGIAIEGLQQNLFDIFEKVYVGHYHDKQSFNQFEYIGSSIQHNYGERLDKGLTVIYEDLSYETVELDFPKYIQFEMDAKDITKKEIDELRIEKESSKDNIRIVLTGDEADINAFNKQQLLDIGISVAKKQDKVEKKEIDTVVTVHTTNTLLDYFKEFCEEKGLDYEKGYSYFEKTLKEVENESATN